MPIQSDAEQLFTPNMLGLYYEPLYMLRNIIAAKIEKVTKCFSHY